MKTYKVTLEDFNPPKELTFTEDELKEYSINTVKLDWYKIHNDWKEKIIRLLVEDVFVLKIPPLIIEEIEE